MECVSTHNLQINEFSLTGELDPVEKSAISLNAGTPLAKRCNIAYSGSFVTSGQGRGIVVATGNSTELAKVSHSMKQRTSLSTPLIRKFDYFNQILLYVVLVLASLTFVLGLGQGRSWSEMFEVVVALVVSAIPQGLPAVLTITLAIGVARMARHNVLIRKLPAVETLSSTTVICSDTGTLTENQMTVQLIWAGQQRYAVAQAAQTGVVFARVTPVQKLASSTALNRLEAVSSGPKMRKLFGFLRMMSRRK